MEERRKSERHRTLKSGHIVFNEGRSAIDCTVRNLSVGGALLRVETLLSVPDDFQLQIGPDVRRAHVTRKWARELAVSFADAES